MSPMVDGWMGDDWFHYGAFRQNSLDYYVGQTSAHGAGQGIERESYDDYDNFLRALERRELCAGWWSRSTPRGGGGLWSTVDDEFLAKQQALDKHPTWACKAIESPHHVDSRPMGSGRHVGSHPLLPGRGAQRHAQ